MQSCKDQIHAPHETLQRGNKISRHQGVLCPCWHYLLIMKKVKIYFFVGWYFWNYLYVFSMSSDTLWLRNIITKYIYFNYTVIYMMLCSRHSHWNFVYTVIHSSWQLVESSIIYTSKFGRINLWKVEQHVTVTYQIKDLKRIEILQLQKKV